MKTDRDVLVEIADEITHEYEGFTQENFINAILQSGFVRLREGESWEKKLGNEISEFTHALLSNVKSDGENVFLIGQEYDVSGAKYARDRIVQFIRRVRAEAVKETISDVLTCKRLDIGCLGCVTNKIRKKCAGETGENCPQYISVDYILKKFGEKETADE